MGRTVGSASRGPRTRVASSTGALQPDQVNEAELDDLLSAPRGETVAAMAACPGDVVVLGAGGKMGPTLARMMVRAASGNVRRRVVAVSRFSSPGIEEALHMGGVETLRCDLLDRASVSRLPDAPNVVFMSGQKFGTAGAPSTTWAMNTIVPAHCAERYRDSRIVCFSTGNVYALSGVVAGGARETDEPGPIGEYAMSCLGRERLFEYYAQRFATRVAILRLNYAIALRYGVLTDLARRVWNDESVALEMGHVNVIWQGDANRIAIECLPRAATPPFVVNVTGHATLSVRELACQLGERLGKAPRFVGQERSDALLSNTDRMQSVFSAPDMPLERMLDLAADWVRSGQPLLGKPTRFEERDGRF
jgi:nucleoside-diphosphate-sugar epimerase